MKFVEEYANHYEIEYEQAVMRLQIASDVCEKLRDFLKKTEPQARRDIEALDSARLSINLFTEGL